MECISLSCNVVNGEYSNDDDVENELDKKEEDNNADDVAGDWVVRCAYAMHQ